MYFPPILPIKSIPNWLKSISSQEIHKYQIVLTCIVCHTFVRNTTHKNEFKRFFLFYEKSIFCRLETEEGESSNCNATKVVLSRKKKTRAINHQHTTAISQSKNTRRRSATTKHQTPLCACDMILFLVYAIGWALVPLTSFQML